MRPFVIVLIALSFVACGERQSSQERAQAIQAQVWSPYCPGRLLTECSTRQARDLRDQIAERVDRGQDEAQILAWVRSEYGASAVARPDARGAGLVLWLMPVVLFAIGGGFVGVAIRRWRRNDRTPESSAPAR